MIQNESKVSELMSSTIKTTSKLLSLMFIANVDVKFQNLSYIEKYK